MRTYYCEADGHGPRPVVDWPARYAACRSEAEIDNVDAERAATIGHFAQNGNPPRTTDLARVPLASVTMEGSPDQWGGELCSVEGAQLRCPVCLSPARACDAVPVPDGVPVVREEVL